MSDARAKIQLDALYSELPTIDCKRKCYDACGPIAMSRVEWQRITKRVGELRGGADLTCPMLKNNLCSVYTIRPMICRLWGVAEGMECHYGCVPDRYLTRSEAYDFLLRAELLSQPEEREAIEEMREHLRNHPDAILAQPAEDTWSFD